MTRQTQNKQERNSPWACVVCSSTGRYKAEEKSLQLKYLKNAKFGKENKTIKNEWMMIHGRWLKKKKKTLLT